jgi:hypothetical protein
MASFFVNRILYVLLPFGTNTCCSQWSQPSEVSTAQLEHSCNMNNIVPLIVDLSFTQCPYFTWFEFISFSALYYNGLNAFVIFTEGNEF